MAQLPGAPAIHQAFVSRYPKLGAAWGLIHDEGAAGPLDAATRRLVKLGIAIGAMREGAVHSSVRKALAEGAAPEALDQVVALAAGTLGMPACVAAFSWVREVVEKHEP
jgi:alkylhydroperoxidase/carboxymuconolactone decarboxylase family protein YurZ